MKKKLAIFLVVMMVLTAVAPSFAATIIVDQPPVGQDAALDELIMLGVLKERRGDDYLKRQDTVVLLSRLMGQEDQAKAYPINHPFNDVSDSFYNGYLGWAYANQYFMGQSSTEFGFGNYITVQQLQIVLLRALGYYLGEFPGWDVVASTANSLGFGASMPGTAIASRGTMATMTTAAIRANYKGTNETLAARLGHEVKMKADDDKLNIVEFRQVDKKVFELECDESILALKNSIMLKRGNITTSIKEITFPTYGKEVARIELNSNVIDTDYTVTITDEKGQVLTSTTRGQRAELTEINITSETAKLKGFDSSESYYVIVNYEKLDQFGNKIAATIDWSGNGTIRDQGGYIEVRGSSQWVMGMQVILTAIGQRTGKAPIVANKTLSVSEPRKAVTLELGDLMNISKSPDEQFLSKDSNDIWVIPVYAYDQDGDLINDVAYFGQKNSSSSNNVILSPTQGVRWYYPLDGEVRDGKEEQVYLKLYLSDISQQLQGGSSYSMYINLVDKNSGANATQLVEVLPNGVTQMSIDVPDLVVAGTPVEFPFVAYNYVGDQVTKYTSIKDSLAYGSTKITKGAKNGFYWEEDANGDAKLMYRDDEHLSSTYATPVYKTLILNGTNPIQLNFTVNPPAVPQGIVGIQDGVYRYYAKDNRILRLGMSDFRFEDQYGMEYENVSLPSGFELVFSGDGNEINNAHDVEIDLNNVGTYTVTATLWQNGSIIDEQTFDFGVLDANDIDSYVVTQIGKVYAPSSPNSSRYGKEVEVKGREAGYDVKLPAGVISNVSAVTEQQYLMVSGSQASGFTVYGTSNGGALTSDRSGQLIVQYSVGGMSKADQQAVVVSPEVPKAVKVELKSAPNALLSGNTISATVEAGDFLVLDKPYKEYSSFGSFLPAFFQVTDQYGMVRTDAVNYMYVKDNSKYSVNNDDYSLIISGTPESGDVFTIVIVTNLGTSELKVVVR